MTLPASEEIGVPVCAATGRGKKATAIKNIKQPPKILIFILFENLLLNTKNHFLFLYLAQSYTNRVKIQGVIDSIIFYEPNRENFVIFVFNH